MLYTIKVSGQPGRCKRESLRPLWSRWEPKQPNRVLLSPKGRIFSYKPFRRPDTIGIPADLLPMPGSDCSLMSVTPPSFYGDQAKSLRQFVSGGYLSLRGSGLLRKRIASRHFAAWVGREKVASGTRTDCSVRLGLCSSGRGRIEGVAEQETFPDPECDFPQVFEPEIRAGTQQVFEMLSAISTVENLLLDIFPTPDAIDYETYSARINLGQPRSGQVTPYRRMGGADDTKNSNSCPLNLPS